MDVLMPQLGETVAEGKISKWFVAAGATVKPGDNLFEIETDKVSMEVPAIAGGTLAAINVRQVKSPPSALLLRSFWHRAKRRRPLLRQSVARAGSRAKNRILAYVAMNRRQRYAPAIPMEPFREVRSPERNYGPARLPGGAVITPLARRLAGEAGIDLANVKGSGPHGRIVARDIETARAKPVPAAAPGAAEQVKALYRDVPYEEIPLDGMRATIAARLTQAVQTIPHFYLSMDVAAGRLMALRAEANAAASKQTARPPNSRSTT